MAGPVTWGVGIVAAAVVLGGVGTASSVVSNSAYTGGATAGVLLGGLDDLFAGFKAGSNTDNGNSDSGRRSIDFNSGIATEKTSPKKAGN